MQLYHHIIIKDNYFYFKALNLLFILHLQDKCLPPVLQLLHERQTAVARPSNT